MNGRRKTTRREFLAGQSMRDALAGIQLSAGPSLAGPLAASASERAAGDYLLRFGRRAMACDFQVFLRAEQRFGAVEAATEALDLIDRLEDQLTVYRPHSEISRINREAGRQRCGVETRLFELLQRCVAWHAATGGAFDITAGPLVRLWGFHTRSGRYPAPEDVQEVLQRVGSQYLELDLAEGSIRFARPGMELNLGSVGKGYALDRCDEVLTAAGVRDFLIHGGHSSILARGSREAAGDAPGWRVALRHPLRADRRLAQLRIADRALGTSGCGQQFFYHHGKRYGHVLDPRHGTPADGVLSATVLAPTAAEADALATAFFILGPAETGEFCRTRPDLAVVFVLPGSRAGTVALETLGLEDGELQVLEA
ncbi:MAG: FAD:protein FMN transferase [Pirellulaceae bacterium]|jgi:thiamine biosynthesis lipoprotein|nr:FAD:protein FMN transferase [Pirellulaceae bacterium]